MTYPVLSCTAIDARNPRALAEFYAALLGLHCRAGDEPPPPPAADDAGEPLYVLGDPEGHPFCLLVG